MTTARTGDEAAAFAIAPAIGAAVLVAVAWLADPAEATPRTIFASSLMALFATYGTAYAVALPLWLVVGRRLPRIAPVPTAIGAIAAMLPILLLSPMPLTKSYVIDGHALVADYHLTALGLRHHRQELAVAAMAGAVGGLAFWALARARVRRT